MRNLINMRPMKLKCIVFLFVLVIFYLFIFFNILDLWFNRMGLRSEKVLYAPIDLKYVIVHMDLKGAPPKLSYLTSLLPTFKHFGVNGILMEYEDTFPYEGKLVNMSTKNCYDRTELKMFLNKSANLGIEIIPLIQTFGHMEHVLKLPEFKHLRETPMYPDTICPRRRESLELINDMLEQVIYFHTSIVPLKHIHVGCDEVSQGSKCEYCHKKKDTDIGIFLEHINILESVVKKISTHTTVLIWDDMLRGKAAALQKTSVDLKDIEPVYWDYTIRSVSTTNLFNYHKKFDNIWIATAFKGADGRTSTIPNIKNRLRNHLCWLNFLTGFKFAGESKVYNFKGIILTGWSRYSHMDPLCELLPVSMPSLILNLILIKRMTQGHIADDFKYLDYDEVFPKYLEAEFNEYFKCENLFDFTDKENTICSYEDGNFLIEKLLFNELINYLTIRSGIKKELVNDGTVLTSLEYYYKIKYINMKRIHSSYNWCLKTLERLINVETKLRKYMSQCYENDAIEEYVSYKMYELKNEVWHTFKMLKTYMDVGSWERRPIQYNISVSEK